MSLFPALHRSESRLVLGSGAERLAHRELVCACRRHCGWLKQNGLGAGARVAVFTVAGIETMVALVANAVAGVVSVPLNPKLGAGELAHILDDAAPTVVMGTVPDRVGLPSGLPQLSHAPPTVDEADLPEAELSREALLILYTSGTTGPPKGAVLSSQNVAANLDGLARAWGWTERDTVVHALPLFHVHGLVLGLFGSVRAGGGLAWFPRFDARELARRVGEGETMLFGVPTMYHRLLEAAERDPEVVRGLRRARLLVSGSAALPTPEHERSQRLLGRAVLERYGLTETLINCAVPLGEVARPGTVGPPVPGVELCLVDDQRRPLCPADGEAMGEVAVRGAAVFTGYLNRPEATAEVMDADGWFYTGDLATRTADGWVRLIGRRATDLIKTGGFKVGAGEVEAALLSHPAVREAAVIGAADPDLGERIVAFVVPRSEPPGSAELIDHVAAQLSPHKRPREVRFVVGLPRNPMGKVQKTELRKQITDG